MLCGDLEGWDEGEVGGRLMGEDTCVLKADLPCCTEENDTTFGSNIVACKAIILQFS